MAHDTVVGVMTLYAPQPFADDQSRMMEMIAPHLAVSIGSALAATAASAPKVPSESDRARPGRSELRVVA